MTVPIRSLDIRPDSTDDALLISRREHWSENPRTHPHPLVVKSWRQEWNSRTEARRRAARRLGYHIITATAPALRKPVAPSRTFRFWRWWANGALMTLASALVAICTVYLLRRGLL